jgi:hypothetical protein
MDALWNAGHTFDPESDMQFCAITPGAAARTESRAILVLKPLLSLQLEPFLRPLVFAIVKSPTDRRVSAEFRRL